jgi:hypothetical protein
MTYKNGTISHTCRQAGYDARARVFWFLTASLIALISLQIVAVGSTTKHVAARQELEKSVANMTARAGELEFNYIAMRNKVDMSVAKELGYQESSNPIYISRATTDSLGTLTFNR